MRLSLMQGEPTGEINSSSTVVSVTTLFLCVTPVVHHVFAGDDANHSRDCNQLQASARDCVCAKVQKIPRYGSTHNRSVCGCR